MSSNDWIVKFQQAIEVYCQLSVVSNNPFQQFAINCVRGFTADLSKGYSPEMVWAVWAAEWEQATGVELAK